jgi:biotin carboxylase
MRLPLLLLGASDAAAYNEYSVHQVAARYPVVLAAPTVPTWARPYLVRHLVVDPANVSAVTAVATDYANSHHFGGVMSLTPEYLPAAAQIAAQLDLQGEATAALAACTDRIAVRSALTHREVPSSRWGRADSAATATAKADLIGYPVMLRPQWGTQRGWCAAKRDDVSILFDLVSGGDDGVSGRQAMAVLVEKDVEWPLISAETVVLGPGDIHIAAITRTTLGPPPARQTVRHSVHAHDPLLHNRLVRQQVFRTVQALGLSRGVLRIDMSLTSHGPHITDVSPHLSGDLVPLLVKRATGVNLPQVAADLAADQPPDLAPTRQHAAAVHFAFSTTSGYIRRITLSTPTHQPLVDRISVTQQRGQYVKALSEAGVNDRLAHLVVLGATTADCHTALDRMLQDLQIDVLSAAASANRINCPVCSVAG